MRMKIVKVKKKKAVTAVPKTLLHNNLDKYELGKDEVHVQPTIFRIQKFVLIKV